MVTMSCLDKDEGRQGLPQGAGDMGVAGHETWGVVQLGP